MRVGTLYRRYGFHDRAAMSSGAIIDILIDRGQLIDAKRLIDEYRLYSSFDMPVNQRGMYIVRLIVNGRLYSRKIMIE